MLSKETDTEQSDNSTTVVTSEARLDRFEPWYLDFKTDPETVRNDKKHWDYGYGLRDELGRLSVTAQIIGEDGFRDAFESLASTHEHEVLPDTFGGIVAVEDAGGDYVAFSRALMDNDLETPESVDDAMVVATDPLVAAAVLRAWYHRQTGKPGIMVQKNEHWRNQDQRERENGWKSEGIDVEHETNEDGARCCDRCGTEIPVGAEVWRFEIPPGREKEGRCGICARAIANGAEDDDWSLNGDDPRDHEVAIRAGGSDD